MSDGKVSSLDCMKRHAERKPNEEAFVFVSEEGEREALTWKDLYLNSCRTAAGFVNIGVKAGEHVMIIQRNCSECIYATLGTMLVGAIPFMCKYSSRNWEDFKEPISRLKTCCLLVVDPSDCVDTWTEIKQYITKFSDDGMVLESELPYVRNILCNELGRNDDTENLRSIYQLIEMNKNVNQFPIQEDVYTIVPTSGTTSGMKLIKRHQNRSIFNNFNKNENVKVYCDLALTRGGLVSTIFSGSTRVLLRRSCDPLRLAKVRSNIIVQERCQTLGLFTFKMEDFLEDQNNPPQNWPVKVVTYGGQSVHPSQKETLGKTAKMLHITYSPTECGSIAQSYITDPAKFEQYCVGFLCEGVTLKIVDDNGEEVPVETRGEIYAKTPRLGKYLDDKFSTHTCFTEDGWFRTGDIGLMRRDHRLFVFGRKVHRITIQDGMVVDPDEIESKLMSLMNVKDVVVVPVKHGSGYQRSCACVVASKEGLTETILRDSYDKLLLDSTGLKNRNALKVDYYLFLERIPRTTTLKFDRKVLATMANGKFAFKDIN